MKKNPNPIPKPRIVLELDPEHMAVLDTARRKLGLSRTNFARSTLMRCILAGEASTLVPSEVAR
ncbi:hypothetical protein ASF18_16785 [Methylobacterium sp. Leaf89]|nr:hypothetical protein ASF18_16785 [Methylobacterium sp. Leaf89]